MGPRIMAREDEEVSSWSSRRFEAEGIDVLTGPQGASVAEIERRRKDADLRARGRGVDASRSTQCWWPSGRAANTRRASAWKSSASRPSRAPSRPTPFCKPIFPTSSPRGDVAGPYQFTHTAAHQAWYAAVNALFGRFKTLQGRLLGDPLGHLHRPRSGPGGPQRAGGQGAGHRLRGHHVTASTTWTGPSPTARPTASSRC